ncbi:MAG: class II aldolase/adducin family protein [Acidimicrobiales bacterium]
MSTVVTPQDVLDAAKGMLRMGLVAGTAGNVSGRLDEGRICLTPSSVSYETMTVDDLVVTDLDGTVLEGARSPTTEKALHLACYRSYPEVGGVIHSHAAHATMFALVHEPIPAVIEEVVVYLGGDVPICDYRGTGTDDLGEEAARNLKDRSACILANHGIVTIGKHPEQALHNAELTERTAMIVWGARALGAKLVGLPEKVNTDMAGAYHYLRDNP